VPFEVPTTVARAVLFHDATICCPPLVEIIATAKRDLKAEEVIDGIGGYMAYGMCENYNVVRVQRLLPMGLSEGCRLKRNIPKDGVLTYDDVEIPAGRLCDKLRADQEAFFSDSRASSTDR
jgi:predicted homoserine dehydrogenase-like protein